MKDKIQKYARYFTEARFWFKLRQFARQAGLKVVYTALLMFYAYRRKETPPWAKRIVLGTLGYLIAPLDAIPDLTPLVGYTDDLGVLSFGLVIVAAYVNDEVKEKARGRLRQWFGHYDEKELAEVDQKL